MNKHMKWVMGLCMCINAFCMVVNLSTGNFGNLPINVVAFLSCIAAIIFD